MSVATDLSVSRFDEKEVSAEYSPPLRQPWLTRSNLILFLTLALVVVMVTRGISKGEFDYNVDESQHAASGIFYASLLKDFPLTHPVQYTYSYYAEYPALSGVLHYPPLFYMVEGLIFRLFGASVITARITTLLFSLMACTFWFRLVNKVLGPWAAALSTLVFALVPSVLLFEKASMLEVPCLALSIAALYFWHTFLTTERIGSLYWFALLGAGAMLTKQHVVFLVLVCPLTAVLLGKWRLFLDRRVLGPLAILAILAGPFYGAYALSHWHTVAVDVSTSAPAPKADVATGHVASLLFYLKALPDQLGWPLLALAVLGAATCGWWGRRQANVFMSVWILGCYLVFTAIPHKEPRYSLYWIPPLAYFLAGPLTARWRVSAVRFAAAALGIVLLANTAWVAWHYERPYLAGYEPLAQRIVKTSNSGVILFDAQLPANFIFFLRNLDHDRHFLVLRKALWSVRIVARYGSEQFARTPDDVRKVIAENGVKFIVVSDLPTRFQAQESLLDVLAHDPQYELVDVFPIETNEPYWQGRHLLLYRNRLAAPPTGEFLHIRMMTLSHDIVLPWSQFKQVW